jgi:hypothetical protein
MSQLGRGFERQSRTGALSPGKGEAPKRYLWFNELRHVKSSRRLQIGLHRHA